MWAEAGGQACLAQHYQPEQATGCPDGDRESPEAHMQPYTQSSIDTYSTIALAKQQASSPSKKLSQRIASTQCCLEYYDSTVAQPIVIRIWV
jgi:hypothetical protein